MLRQGAGEGGAGTVQTWARCVRHSQLLGVVQGRPTCVAAAWPFRLVGVCAAGILGTWASTWSDGTYAQAGFGAKKGPQLTPRAQLAWLVSELLSHDHNAALLLFAPVPACVAPPARCDHHQDRPTHSPPLSVVVPVPPIC